MNLLQQKDQLNRLFIVFPPRQRCLKHWPHAILAPNSSSLLVRKSNAVNLTHSEKATLTNERLSLRRSVLITDVW